MGPARGCWLAGVWSLGALLSVGCGGTDETVGPPAVTRADVGTDTTDAASAIDVVAEVGVDVPAATDLAPDTLDVAGDAPTDAEPGDAVAVEEVQADATADAPNEIDAAEDADVGATADGDETDAADLQADAPDQDLVSDGNAEDAPVDAAEDLGPDAAADAVPDAAEEVQDAADAEPDLAPADVCLASAADCLQLGVCAAGGVLATCAPGGTQCGYDAVLHFEAVETSCDGLDNDCDGQTDKALFTPNFVGSGVQMPGAGVCLDAPLQCSGGVWSQPDFQALLPAYQPTETSCDGLDNDCNGLTDDIAAPPQAILHVGVCVGLTALCGGSAGWQDPDYKLVSAFGLLAEGSCDGLDNDCDGMTDEDALCPLWQIGGSGSGKIALHPDGTQVATLSRTGVQVLDVASGARILDWFGHQDSVLDLAWSPDGTRLGSVGRGDVLQVYASQPGAKGPDIAIHLSNTTFTALAFSPDGSQVAVGDSMGSLLIYAVPAGDLVAATPAHNTAVSALAWTADGKALLSGDLEGQLLRWVPQTGTLTALGVQAAAITDLCVRPGAATVLVCRADLLPHLIDQQTGALVLTLAGHAHTTSACAWNALGTQAWTLDKAGEVRRWTLPALDPPQPLTLTSAQVLGAPSMQPGEDAADLAVAPTAIVLGLTRSGPCKGPSSGAAGWTIVGERPLGAVQVLAASGGVLASAGDDAKVRLWQSGGGQYLVGLDGHEAMIDALDIQTSGASGPGPLFAQSPLLSGAMVVSGSADFSLRLWSVQPSGLSGYGVLALAALGLGGPWPTDAHFGGGGLWTAGGGTAFALSTASGSLGQKLAAYATGFGNTIEAIAPSPDGQHVALGMSGKGSLSNINYRVLDAQTLKVEVDAPWLPADRHVLAWSPDGARIAAAGGPALLVLLDAKSGVVLESVYGHQAPITALAWSPSGQRLLSTSADGSARVWSVKAGQDAETVALWTRHCPPPCVQVSVTAGTWLDNGVAATASDDGAVMGWRAP